MKELALMLLNGNPYVSQSLVLPEEIYFSYDPTKEHAIVDSIIDGTARWTIGLAEFSAITIAGGSPLGIFIGFGMVMAEMAPDIEQLHKKALTELDNLIKDESYKKYIL